MKKLVFLSLAALFSLSVMSGCGGSSSEVNSTAVPSKAPVASATDQQDAKATDEVPAAKDYEITILTILHEGNIIQPDHPNFKSLEEHTGYKVTLEYVLNSNYDEQINTRLASGDLPGLVVLTGNTAPIVSAAKSGAFWDITDIYKNYPNLAQSNENILKNISIDGRIYGIYRARTIGRNGITYRSDWLENLGLEEPKTLDDLYNVLHAFTYDDPDQNGANDTYGMTWCTFNGPFNNLAIMHGAPNMWGLDSNNKLYPWFESEGYKEAMDYSKKLFDEGLINKDFAALQSGDWVNDFNTGKSGIHMDVADQANRSAVKLKDNGLITQEQVDDGSIVWVMSPISNSKGEKHTLPTTGHMGYVAITKSGAKTEADRDEYLNFMDKCNDAVGQNILNYGTEGVTYELTPEGNVKVYTAEEIVAKSGAGMDVVLGWNQFLMNNEYLLKLKQNPRQVRQDEVYTENLEFCVYNPVLALSSETYIAKSSTLEQIIADATVNYVMGNIDRAGFEKEIQRWYQEGGQNALDEFQAAYDAVK